MSKIEKALKQARQQGAMALVAKDGKAHAQPSSPASVPSQPAAPSRPSGTDLVSRAQAAASIARMQEQAGAIRRELGLLFQDVERLGVRVDNLDRHFGQASKDLADIKISADKAGKRARRLDNFDFEELSPDPEPAKLVMTPIVKK